MPSEANSPDVGVVIPTHNRPELVRKAIDSVLAQDYPGTIAITVVFDRSEPDPSLTYDDSRRCVAVTTNVRTPGLAGARNSGILADSCELVAFCDDDDTWMPGKLQAQVDRLRAAPRAEFVTTAVRVDYPDERSVVRRAGQSSVSIDELARSRYSMLHSSSFLFRRSAMLDGDGFGLVDESLPGSFAEDWDLLLRASRRAPIEHVDEPLVAVLRGATSYFNSAWKDKNEAHLWLLDRHPEMRADRVAHAHLLSKLAFGHAALGDRRSAMRYSRAALRTNWREPRTPFALLVVAGISSEMLQRALTKRGHGI